MYPTTVAPVSFLIAFLSWVLFAFVVLLIAYLIIAVVIWLASFFDIAIAPSPMPIFAKIVYGIAIIIILAAAIAALSGHSYFLL